MVIKPMIRSNICMNAHPLGAQKEVMDDIAYVRGQAKIDGPKNVLVLGASNGYGLASRIVAAFGAEAHTFAVSFDREPSGKRTGTSGYYNTKSMEYEARRAGLIAEGINGDAFSHEVKAETVRRIRELFGTIDLLVYSLASPMRKDPDSGVTYKSVLKPIAKNYTAKSINTQTGEISTITIEPASEEEITSTINVMGGDDWILWINTLLKADLLSRNFTTVAYSYIGPELTRAVYRDGTIGKAKENLEAAAHTIRSTLQNCNGRAFVSVNKALVTRASAVIPVVPLYLSLLFKIMKERGTHENCIEQMYRLFADRLYGENPKLDEEGRIRMDDLELDESVQHEVNTLWPQVSTENIHELADLDGYNADFLGIHGFGRTDIDYDADIDPDLNLV